MAIYYKICSDCGTRNPYTSSVCSNCSSSIVMARTISEEESDQGENHAPCTEKYPGRQFRRCQVCSTLNYLNDGRDVRVCSECGNDELYKSPIEQEALEAPETEAPEKQPSCQCRKLSLECLQEDFRLEIPEKGGIIGRNGTIGQTFFQNKKFVSGEHAFISPKGHGYTVVDRKSTNKTRINGEILQYGLEYTLEDGMLITFADVSFRVRLL